jgi:hypothetical protein
LPPKAFHTLWACEVNRLKNPAELTLCIATRAIKPAAIKFLFVMMVSFIDYF